MPSDSVSLERKVSVLFIGEEPKDRPGLDLTREIEVREGADAILITRHSVLLHTQPHDTPPMLRASDQRG